MDQDNFDEMIEAMHNSEEYALTRFSRKGLVYLVLLAVCTVLLVVVINWKW